MYLSDFHTPSMQILWQRLHVAHNCSLFISNTLSTYNSQKSHNVVMTTSWSSVSCRRNMTCNIGFQIICLVYNPADTHGYVAPFFPPAYHQRGRNVLLLHLNSRIRRPGGFSKFKRAHFREQHRSSGTSRLLHMSFLYSQLNQAFVLSLGMLPSRFAMLYYVMDAEMLLQPKPAPHRGHRLSSS